MSAPNYERRVTLHAPEVVMSRGRAHLMFGEPRCKAPKYPGCTTSEEAHITCDACLEILERGRAK